MTDRRHLACPCCGEDAVPPHSYATAEDVEGGHHDPEEVAVGDPLWLDGQEARCPCGCLVSVAVEEGGEAWTRAACVDAEPAALAACPCAECRRDAARMGTRGPRALA